MTTLTPTEQLLLAIQVATRAHAGQKRKDGTDYIAHPMSVMAKAALAGEDTYTLIACVLHDVPEDTSVGFKQLRELGFGNEPLEAVDAVTKRPGESYLGEFIPRVKKSERGTRVKLYDIDHNTEDQSALDPDEAEFLTKRYTTAREILNGD